MLVSYAQNFEDVMLWRALGHVDVGTPKGFYIDVGAQDPIVDSVSLAFYEKGWRGIHVEPLHQYVRKLRKSRPDENVIQAVVGAKAGTLTLFAIPDTGLSTADRAIALRHSQAGYEVHEEIVPCVTLDSVLEQAGREVHWLKIDVEGLERQVLHGWKKSPIRPWVVVIESTLPLTETPAHHKWEKLIVGKGYRFAYFDGVNRFYVSSAHPELMAAFGSGPNVFDDFALSGTASSRFSAVLNETIAKLQAERGQFEASKREAVEATGREFTLQLDEARQAALRASQSFTESERALSAQLHDAQQAALRVTQDAAERERTLAETIAKLQAERGQIEASKREALEAAGQKFTLQLDEARQAALRASQSFTESERALSAQLHDAQQAALRTSQDAAERERTLAETIAKLHAERGQFETSKREALEAVRREVALKLDEARQIALRASQASRESERTLSVQLHDAQQAALRISQDAAERERTLAAQLNSTQQAAHERNRLLAAQLRDAQQETLRVSQDATERERRLASELGEARAESVRQQQAAAQRERELKDQLHAAQRDAQADALDHARELRALQASLQSLETRIRRQQYELASQHARVIQEVESQASFVFDPGKVRAWHLEDFDVYEDDAFVRSAYQVLLRRAPDPDGLEYYLSRIRNGDPKLRILGEIRYSEEGKRTAVEVHGLTLAYAMDSAAHRPLVGGLFRFAGALLAQLGVDRRQRLIENRNARLRDRAFVQAKRHAALLEQFEPELEGEFAKFRERLDSAQAARRSAASAPAPGDRKGTVRSKARTLYYFADHTPSCPVNTGIQRVTRRLAKALLQAGEKVRFVKWDENLRKIVLASKADLGRLSRWGGPELAPEALASYPDDDAHAVPIPDDATGAGSWLIVPEVTHITFHPRAVTLDVITEARSHDLLTAFVFYDAIPLKRPEFSADAPRHETYMQQLLLADLVLPISHWAGQDLVSFLKVHECASLSPTPKIVTTPLPGESLLAERVPKASSPGSKTILSVGTIEPRKNQVALLRAFQRFAARPSSADWDLVLVGNLHPDVAAEVRRATVANSRIRYLEHVPDSQLDELYRACAFTVFPSVEEGFGLPILESLWYAKPCVCANFGAMAEVASGGGCLTVDTRDEDALTDAIAALANEPERLQKLSAEAAARPIVTWDQYAGTLVSHLDAAADPLARLGIIYYWVDHTCKHPRNSGIQRVTRSLGKALMDLGLRVIPAKWDVAQGKVGPLSKEELEHLARWNGPQPSQWSAWKPPSQQSKSDWLLIPELTTYLPQADHHAIAKYAGALGLRRAAVFFDAIPWKLRDIYPSAATQAHQFYMNWLNGFELVLPISSWTAKDLVHFLSCDPRRTNALLERIQPCPLPGEFSESRRSTEARRALDRTTVLCVGTVEPRKNHLVLLDAFANLVAAGRQDVELVIAGSGHDFPELAAEVRRRMEALPSVRWENSVDDARLGELYEQADFTVYPSIEEGFGLPILESIWHARPCLCASFGVMAEIAEGGGCLTADVRDAQQLAQALQTLLDDRKLRERLTQEAAHRPLKDWAAYAHEVAVHLATERNIPYLQPLPEPADPAAFRAAFVNLPARPTLSVCITTYNRADWLAVNLKNLARLASQPRPDIEFLICDNTSTDHTPDVVRPYLARPDFRYIRNPENVGMLGNLRVTAHHARGKYVWIVGDDDLILPGALERIVATIDAHPGTALVYLNYAYTREDNPGNVTDLDAFLRNTTPISAPGPDITAPVREICTESENFFTAIYCLVFRRDHALRAYSQNTRGRPFSTLLTCIPTTYHVLSHMMEEEACWIGEPQIVVNLNVSWMKYAPLWILERIPEVYDLAERLGAEPARVDRWRLNNLPGVVHFFREIFGDDPEGNADYFNPLRLVSRMKHLEEFRKNMETLKAVYLEAQAKGHATALLPATDVFPSFD